MKVSFKVKACENSGDSYLKVYVFINGQKMAIYNNYDTENLKGIIPILVENAKEKYARLRDLHVKANKWEQILNGAVKGTDNREGKYEKESKASTS